MFEFYKNHFNDEKINSEIKSLINEKEITKQKIDYQKQKIISELNNYQNLEEIFTVKKIEKPKKSFWKTLFSAFS